MSRYAATGDRKQGFIRRMRNMRSLGLGLAALCVAAVLWERGANPLWWALLALTCLVWPHIGHLHARKAADPVRAEFGNLSIDSVFGGLWVAAMGFNLLPSVVLLSMLWIGDVGTGGVRFLARCAALQVGTALLAYLTLGVPFAPESSMFVVTACLPFLLVYPVATSFLAHRLTVRVRRQKQLLERIVCTDGLTGLANRQHFEWNAERVLDRAKEGDGHAALLMIDVDEFKSINDRYGHLLGDEVIATVARTLRAAVRADDVAGRYAGDEFAVVLPHADAATAHTVAERFRRDVARLRFPGAPVLRCTVSVGVAIVGAGETGVDLKRWIGSADDAMYVSKRSGRNRVTIAAADDDTPPPQQLVPLARRAG